MSGTGLQHPHVEMADASTSTAEDRETDLTVQGISESPINFNDSAFIYPKPNYGYVSYNQTDDNVQRGMEKEIYTSDPYNDLRDEVSISESTVYPLVKPTQNTHIHSVVWFNLIYFQYSLPICKIISAIQRST